MNPALVVTLAAAVVVVAAAVAVAARHIVPADAHAPRWSGIDLSGALIATASLATFVYALSQASSAGWDSTQTLGLGGLGLLDRRDDVHAVASPARPALPPNASGAG